MPACIFSGCDNPSKCVLNTLQFAHLETGQTPEDRVAVIKVTIKAINPAEYSSSDKAKERCITH